MKAALISFHNAYNYGACLQAYALQEVVTDLGVECEYIDYINERRASGYKMSTRISKAVKNHDVKGAVKNICGAPFVWLRGEKFDKFYRDHLKRTNEVYHSCNEASVLEKKYDKFIVGSDQVWNDEHNGYDTAYFLDFVSDNSKKISYSSSFGMADIPADARERYARVLNNIECLSTREMHGVEIIRQLTGRKAHLVLDPVLLLSADKWKKIIPTSKKKERYTFYYMNARFNPDDFGLVTGWKDRKKHILSASVNPKDFVKKNQKITFAMSPEEFLYEINEAELIVTTSFHCLAFSIIFHKPFVAILSGDEGRDERLINLLRITGLEDRVYSSDMTLQDVTKHIDYGKVEERLKTYRDYSMNFLKTSLFEGKYCVEALLEPGEPLESRENFVICSKEKCTGCGVCYAKCPKKAIAMIPDREGFLRPVIDNDTCVRCGICRKNCPSLKNVEVIEDQHYYALCNTDDVRKKSSSGGAFTALAEKVIASGGIVVASEMNRDWVMAHTIAENIDEIRRQACTFYVQGEAFSQFSEIENILQNERSVLFVGTPCQVAGLKSFLGKEYEKLITCDILCHGIPSPEMFGIYINYLKSKGKLTSLKQRDKSLGWKGYCVSAVIDKKKYKNDGWLKAYSVMFSHSLINRISCFSCKYSNYNRVGDITIGDYWGVYKYHPELKDNLGISLVITNNAKGDAFFHDAANRLRIVTIKKEETAQNSLLHPKQQPMRRTACIITMMESYEKAAKKYGEWNLKGKLKEKIRQIIVK